MKIAFVEILFVFLCSINVSLFNIRCFFVDGNDDAGLA